jgi:hypothetical protein
LAGGGESSSARKAYARQVKVEDILLLQRPSKLQEKDSMILEFSEEDAKEVSMPHDDALVVIVTVANHVVHRVLVDNGSSANILYWTIFQQLGIGWEKLKPFVSPLVGFMGEQVQPIGLISLPITVGTTPKQATIMVDFLVVNRPFAYNAIINHPALNQLKAATSTYHLKMKFSMLEGVGEVKGDQSMTRRCYNTSLKAPSGSTLLTISNMGSREKGGLQKEPAESLIDIEIVEGKVLKIRSQLTPETHSVLI